MIKKYNAILYSLVFILIFTLPFKFGIIRGGADYNYPKFIPIGIGIFELISALMLYFKKFRKWGAILAICLFSGAIVAHIFVLGIWYGKIMFPLALIGLIFSIYIFRKSNQKMLE